MSLILLLLLAKHAVWTPKSPPRLPSDTVYIQIHTTRKELDRLKAQCKQYGGYAQVNYPGDKYIILPCSALEEK